MYEVKNVNSLYVNYSEQDYLENMNKKLILKYFDTTKLCMEDIFEGTCFHTEFIEKFNIMVDKINYETKISLGDIISYLENDGYPLKNLLKLLDSNMMENLKIELSLKHGLDPSLANTTWEEEIFE